MVAMGNKASADTARRTRRNHKELAEAGVPVGARRAFGWQEAREAREAIDKLIAGVKLTGILADWRKRGIKTTAGKDWRWPPFTMYLRNPAWPACGRSPSAGWACPA